ncbi:extracellular solute-binding protein [Paenibacillus eucommiae]|uniref:Aldouronate transport system substrate-binding protein n=1 Tax=Paenibacillus eucommiae TaxID=1355755 RepID=A0ABS4JCH3_9BACL|nr:extracellular solute-binding protein [Paenibacillus eucommiae]MBP1996895.1 putative aldouronate transport system substrate-binding protein [Paenibacillus eucommiae]
MKAKMKAQVGQRLLLVCLSLMLVLVTACSSAPKDKDQGKESTEPAGTSAPSDSQGNNPDPTGKYDPPITVSTVRSMPPDQYYDEGESIDKNAIYDYYEEELGIKLVNDWSVSFKEYPQKIKISIASNNLPDFYMVGAGDLQQLIDSDMAADLTQLWEDNASEDTKKEFTKDGGRQMKTATFNGKLMAIPQINSPYNNAQFVWIRKDWLTELNLPEPKTMQDVLTISEAFSKRDTGGKGKALGFGLTKDLSELIGFYNGYHAYPQTWVKDASGNLVFGSIQPEMKTALKQLQDMFKAGQIDPEFGVKDFSKMAQSFATGQLGMFYGGFAHSLEIQKAVVKDDEMSQEWVAYPIPSVDGKPALMQTSASVYNYYVVNKNAKNPEAAIRILNKWIENQVKPSESNSILLFGKKRQGEGLFYRINPILAFLMDGNVISGELLPKAIKDKDPSSLGNDIDRLARYSEVQDYLAGDEKKWFQWMIAKEGGTMALMNEAYKKDGFYFNEFYGAFTPSMSERKAVLDTKENEMVTKIILGKVSIDAFDTFVDEWKKLGGDKITQEVNEWYQAMK